MLNVSEIKVLSDQLCQDEVQCIFHYTVAPTGYFLLGTFICLGNLLTIVAVMRSERLRTLQNMHIISLAVADLITGCCVFCFFLMHFRPVAIYMLASREFCVFFLIFYVTLSTASNASIIFIAVDRYLYIVYPFKYVIWITESRTKNVIAFCWLFAFGVGLGTLYFETLDDSPSCFLYGSVDCYFQLVSNTLPFFAVCVLSAVMYTKIIKTVRRQQRKVVNETEVQSNETRLRYKLKNIKLLIAVCGFYIMCWLPFHLTFFNYIVTGYSTSNMSFLVLLGLINSGVNFVVYPCMNRDFREAFLSILCRCKIHRNDRIDH